MERERNETNELWRGVHAEQRRQREEQQADAVQRLDRLVAAGELTYRLLNGPVHIRIACGLHEVDLWPSLGRWRVLGEHGRTRLGGLGGVLNWLGVDRTQERG